MKHSLLSLLPLQRAHPPPPSPAPQHHGAGAPPTYRPTRTPTAMDVSEEVRAPTFFLVRKMGRGAASARERRASERVHAHARPAAAALYVFCRQHQVGHRSAYLHPLQCVCRTSTSRVRAPRTAHLPHLDSFFFSLSPQTQAADARATAIAEVGRLMQHPEHLRRLPDLRAEYESKRAVSVCGEEERT